MRIREFRQGDEAALHDVFWAAVHGIASRDYTPQQVNAWAPRDFDAELWAQRVRRNRPFIVEIAGKIVAFADVQPSGYIDHFYVGPAVEGQGVGAKLMEHLQAAARARGLAELSSDVSRTAQRFFERFGFVVVEQRARRLRGVEIQNAFMVLRFDAA